MKKAALGRQIYLGLWYNILMFEKNFCDEHHIFGDETPFSGLSGSATDRKILAVTDTVEKARDLVRRFEKSKIYEYVDFEVMDME